MARAFIRRDAEGNQFVELPVGYEFQAATDVAFVKVGEALVISPVKKTWTSFADVGMPDSDYMNSRPNIF